MAARLTQFARDTGALVHLQLALNFLARSHLLAGELAAAALMIEAFEREVETVLGRSGMPVTGTAVKRICGRRLLSAAGADLGDIDAIALDPASKTIIVAEAKDFELARTPAGLANEAEDLLTATRAQCTNSDAAPTGSGAT